MPRFSKPPIALTFLAPADRCNQSCPACIIDRVGEPTRSFELSPDDYVLIVRQILEADVPILSIAFQGYEVTLPRSWPYVEAVFEEANRHNLRKSFITNGMLLHKWTDRIQTLQPDRITVSLDGADPEINDPIRGLDGAFHATTSSLRRFIEAAPDLRERLKVTSTLFDDANADSLRRMPALLRELGIPLWSITVELHLVNGREQPAQPLPTLQRWIEPLRGAADAGGIDIQITDLFGFLGEDGTETTERKLYGANFLVRVEPAGFVRVGEEIIEAFDPENARRFHPGAQHILDVIDYRPRAERLRRQLAAARNRQPRGHRNPGDSPNA